MPTYEMPLLLKIGTKIEYTKVLKQVADSIFRMGGIIRKIENWGDKDLPCKASVHGKTHRKAGHFLFCFDVPPVSIKEILKDCGMNYSIIRARAFVQNEFPINKECTLTEELLPAPYRSDVQKLIRESQKKKINKHEFKYDDKMKYYPFLR